MNCLEFKRLALSDPNSDDLSFIAHSETCPECLKYVGSVREMDKQLGRSLDATMPDSLAARLELNQILQENRGSKKFAFVQYAKVAGIAVIMFASGFFVHDRIDQQPVADDSLHVSDGIVVKLVDHIEKNPMVPVWNSDQANRTMQSLLAIYDSSIKLKEMARLQFIKICPMDENRQALHANLETDHGQITFAYVKGDSVSGISDNSYKGYVTRIKPIRGGNLLIISRNMVAVEDADKELQSAIYWDL